MTIDNQLRKIRTITSLQELHGYLEQARKRGITAEEMSELEAKRKQLEKRR